MDIWQSGSDPNQYLHTGWLGRVLDATCTNDCVPPHFAVEVDDSLSLALKGETISGFAVRDPRTLKKPESILLLMNWQKVTPVKAIFTIRSFTRTKVLQ